MMTKYYKYDFTHLIINGKTVMCITTYGEKDISLDVVEHFDDVFDYSDLEECSQSEALAAFHKFENRCKEIINSTGL